MGRSSAWPLAILTALTVLPVPKAFAQEPPPAPAFLERTRTTTDGDVRVTVAALSSEESAEVYGAPLAARSIQPVWLQIENTGEHSYWLLPSGLDPHFFPASEAAETMATGLTAVRVDELTRRFESLAFRSPVRPGETVTGFVLTNLHEGVKPVQIDLFSRERSHSLFFLPHVPGFRADYLQNEVFEREIHAGEEVVDYTDDASFRAALAALPCCATNESGSRNGDPLNLVVVGGVDEAFPAFVRRGWSPTEATWSGSVLRMVGSALSRERYPYAPISNLYLYGRAQDLALQKARDNVHQRNHLRLWKSPMRYHGQEVWVGQISRDIGSRMTIHSPTLTTHKIDPDVDAAAWALAEDLAYSQALRKLAFAQGVGAAPREAPRENLTRDPYFTDGLRTVLFFDRAPTSLAEIEVLQWEARDSPQAATVAR